MKPRGWLLHIFLARPAYFITKFLIDSYVYCALIHRATANAIFNTPFDLLRWTSSSRISINIIALPLVWMDETTSSKRIKLRQGSRGVTYAPHFIGRKQATESIFLPDVYCHVFNGVRISATSSSIIINDQQVVMDRAIGPDQNKYSFAGSHILRHSSNTAIVRLEKKIEYIEIGIFLAGLGSSNYYHWMVEILVKVEFLSKLPAHYSKYPLLISEDAIQIPSFKETLELFAKGRELIVLGKQLAYMVGELIFINSPNNLPFNLSSGEAFKCAYVTIDNLSIQYLRTTALQAAIKNSANSNYPKKIFLCRRGNLRRYNQNEVFDYLSGLGFTKIFMEDLSFLEQVRTMRSANVIVGPTGAAWTNLIFCNPGTKALCWMADEFGDFSAYSTIAAMVGVDLRYLTYRAGVYSTGELYGKDYNIKLNLIEKGLSALAEI